MIEHGQVCANFVEHDRVVFIVDVGLHGAEERVTQDSICGGAFGQPDRDGGRASIDFIGESVSNAGS